MTAMLALLLTVAVYILSKWVYRRIHVVMLSPVLSGFLMVVLILLVTHTSYPAYMSGGKYLTEALQPATVAFAIPLYRNFHILKKYALSILLSLTAGSLTAILTSIWLAKWFNLGMPIVRSIAPRSVTTPIAMEISHSIGGSPVLTAVFVIFTGITGLVVGPGLIHLLKIRSSIGKGTLMGMGAHGIGTARAFEDGPEEGSIASLSMVLAGCITILLTPILMHTVA